MIKAKHIFARLVVYLSFALTLANGFFSQEEMPEDLPVGIFSFEHQKATLAIKRDKFLYGCVKFPQQTPDLKASIMETVVQIQ